MSDLIIEKIKQIADEVLPDLFELSAELQDGWVYLSLRKHCAIWRRKEKEMYTRHFSEKIRVSIYQLTPQTAEIYLKAMVNSLEHILSLKFPDGFISEDERSSFFAWNEEEKAP